MITNITHSLDLSIINENAFSNILILDDRDNVHFEYKNVPFHFSVSEITESEKEELVYIICDQRPASEEDLEFHWLEITYNLAKNDFITFACVLPNLWQFHAEIIENEDESITIYASIENEAQENETVEYSLVAPNSVKYKKLEFTFGQSAYKLFEGLNNMEIDFHFIYDSLVATPKSENIFIKIEQEIKVPKDCLEIKLLNEIDNSNYDYDFSTEFTCQIENEKNYFKIGNIQFEYEI